jgi:hypothetical protein
LQRTAATMSFWASFHERTFPCPPRRSSPRTR